MEGVHGNLSETIYTLSQTGKKAKGETMVLICRLQEPGSRRAYTGTSGWRRIGNQLG
jgi:hypothetical protein